METSIVFVCYSCFGVYENHLKGPQQRAENQLVSMNALNTIVANATENSKLGELGFDENDLFSPPGIEEKVYGRIKTIQLILG
jgi:hypothetical protein